MTRTRKGSTVKKGLKFLVFGEQGTRKSSFAADLLKMINEDGRPLRVAYIDTENGSIDNYLESLEDDGVDLDNLFLIYTSSYSEVEKYLKDITNEADLYIEDEDGNKELLLDADGNKFVADAIVVDSLTVTSDNVKFAAINVSEKRAKIKAISQDKTAQERFVAESTAGLEFKDFDKINMKGKSMLRNIILNTDKIVVVTAREKEEKEMKSVDGKMQLVSSGKFLPDTWKGAAYEFFTVIRNFFPDHSNKDVVKYVIDGKDRTKVFNPGDTFEQLSPMNWQCVIDSNKGKKTNKSANTDYDEIIKQDEKVIGGQDFEETEEKSELVEELKQIKQDMKKLGKLSATNQTKLKKMFADEGLKSPLDLTEANIEFGRKAQEFLNKNLK